MRIIAVIVFVFNLNLSANTHGQNVSLTKHDITLKEVFNELRTQTGYYFIYNSKEVPDQKKVSTKFVNTPLDVVLASILKDVSLTYTIEDKVISLKPISPISKLRSPSEASQQQSRTITGNVTDADDGSIMYGVSVRVKGTAIGAATNADGNFSLSIKPSDKVLVFSFIGYATREIPITSANKYEVMLAKNNQQLQEVVIAFGTSKRNELTNSVSTVSAKDIENRPISNLSAAIVGAAPGVQTDAGSGQPGDGPSIRIRGFTSVTNDNEPLYIVDGAPYEGVLSNINPDDIESISILKDASSTALYGARAANGVVLVTTKRGKEGGNVITAKVSTAASTRALPRYETLDAYEYFPITWEIIKNSNADNAELATKDIVKYIGWNPFNVSDDEIVYTNGQLNPNARLLYPDDTGFSDELGRIGIRTDAGLTFSGGSRGSDQYFSLNYLDEKGYVVGSDFKRLSGRLRVNTTPAKWLKVGLNISANFTTSDRANQSSGINENPFYVDLVLAPIYPVFRHDPYTGAYLLDANGNKIYDRGDYKPMFAGRNIVYETFANINNDKRNSFTAVNTIDANLIKNVKFSSNFSAYINNFRAETYDNSEMGDAYTVGKSIRTNSNQYYLNWSKLLTWSKSYNRHKVSVLVGHENYYNYWDQITGTGTGETIGELPVLDNMTSTKGASYDRLYTTQGFLSKADYSYAGKYIFSASARRDGSSRFAGKNKWGNFWALSGAYNISDEKFFNVKWVNNLKIRGSYGLVGNDRTGNYFTSKRLYNLGANYGYEGGAYLSQAGNPNLQWETNTSMDVAVEASMFKSRLNATIEVFRRKSENLLFDVALPLTSGLYTMDENFGSMKNEGIEIELEGTPIRKRNFRWNVSLNATTLRNRILSLPPSYVGLISGTKRYDVGQSIYEFWLRDWVGVNPRTGGNLYEPLNPSTSPVVIDGVTYTSSGANAKYKYFGSSIPDVFGGITNTFSHKNLSLRVLVTYQIGGQTYDGDYQRLTNLGTYGRAFHKDMLRRWQNSGDITDVPKPVVGNTSYNSDRMLVDADYINLRTIALTYNFTKKFAKKLNFSNARAFINGENLYISSKRKGLDPTQTYTGDSNYTYAPSRIVSLGLNITL